MQEETNKSEYRPGGMDLRKLSEEELSDLVEDIPETERVVGLPNLYGGASKSDVLRMLGNIRKAQQNRYFSAVDSDNRTSPASGVIAAQISGWKYELSVRETDKTNIDHLFNSPLNPPRGR
jgi:hypothetical protein